MYGVSSELVIEINQDSLVGLDQTQAEINIDMPIVCTYLSIR